MPTELDESHEKTKRHIFRTSRMAAIIAVAILVALALTVLTLSTLSTINANEQNLPATNQTLQTEKLRLEVLQLRQQVNPPLGLFLLQSPVVTLSVAIVAALAAVLNTNRTLSRQKERNREERIASLIDKLGDPRESVRLGAAQALAQYPVDGISSLLLQLKTDGSQRVREGIIGSLSQADLRSFRFLRDANLFARRDLRDTILGLVALSTSVGEITQASGLDAKEIERFKADPGLRKESENWKKRELVDASGRGDLVEGLILRAEELRKFSAALALTIAKALKNFTNRGEASPADLSEMDLRATNLSEVIFKGLNLRETILRNALLARTTISDTSFEDTDLTAADFSKSSLNGVRFVKCAPSSSTNFDGCSLDSSSFKETTFGGARFKGCSMVKSDLSNASLWHARFDGANLSGSNLEAANIGGAQFDGANLGEANLQKVRAKGTNFHNANFLGANLKGADFRNAKLKGVKGFWLVGDYDEDTNLYGANWWDALLADSERESSFYKYVSKKFPQPPESSDQPIDINDAFHE